MLLLLGCDVPPAASADSAVDTDPPVGRDTGSALDTGDTGVTPEWVDRRLLGASQALPLGQERVVVTHFSGGEADSCYCTSWLLDPPADGATRDDAVADGFLAAFDVLGDVDADGIGDWLGGDGQYVWVLSGAAAGTLDGSAALRTISGVSATASPDLDGDDVPDVVTGLLDITAWSGAPGDEGPFATVGLQAGEIAQAAAAPGDLDGDGLADLAFDTCCTHASDLRWLPGPLSGDLSASDALDLEDPPYASATRSIVGAGDLDGDGLGDVAVVTDRSMGVGIGIYAGGALVAVREGGEGAALQPRCAGDLDGDGRWDIAIGGTRAPSIVHGPVIGTHTITDVGTPLEGPPRGEGGAVAPSVGDVDGDGISDVLLGVVADRDTYGAHEDVVWIGLGPL